MKYNPNIVRAYFRECGLPEPVLEHEFARAMGRKYRADFAFPREKLAVEVEGGVYTRRAHGSITGILRDMDKANHYARLGWRLLRVLPDDLCTQDTVDMIKQALAESPEPLENAGDAQ